MNCQVVLKRSWRAAHPVYRHPSFQSIVHTDVNVFCAATHMKHAVVKKRSDRQRAREKTFSYGNNNIKMAEQIEIHVNFSAVREKENKMVAIKRCVPEQAERLKEFH
jgi:hypothetical protein